ncbi:MAG TPA: collagen-binding domain-containing protein, partial [Actinopolymorphaceae bacterium]|nr:collagen-binding domain-containing protein [Actinopolymorphaceae bacterium]
MPDRPSGHRRTLAATLAVLLVMLVGAQAVPRSPGASAAPPTGSPLNPVSGNQGFLVFAEGNAALNSNESAGAVALGGDLTLSQTDLALGRTITASSSASDRPPSNADDGDVQTLWQSSSGAFPQTLTVDLGSTQTVDQIVLRLPTAFTTRSQTLSVLGSTNGSSFSTVVTSAAYTFNPVTGNTVTIPFSSINRRYFRLNITANTAVTAGQISELEVRRASSGGGNVYDVASQTAGTFTAPGDARPTGLLVGGRMDWAGSAGNGYLFVRTNGYVKVGNLTGTDISQDGGSSTHLVIAGDTYNSQPGIALDLAQPTGSVNQSGLIDFAGAFSTFRTRSSDLAACTNNVVLRNSGGTPLPPTLPAGTNAFITLTPGAQNILNITAANLANISTLTFTNHPNASTPIVINVNTSGVSDDFSWRPPSPSGLNDADSPFILWNFPTATRVTVTGSNPVRGTLYAPRAGLFQYDVSGVYGGVVAQSYAQGGPSGSPSGGTTRNLPFSTSVQTCGAELTLEKDADMTSTAPGGRVAYTVAATNTGGSTLTGATFNDPLAGVLDDATYDNDAAATTGSVNVIGSNLSWTGDLPAGATATISYSVTVRSPDTGNHRLVNTLTSTTPNSNCAAGSGDGRCSTNVPVADLVIDKSASVTTTSPGDTVDYTVTVTNAGQTAYTGISVADDLTGALDDAAFTTASATAGSVTFTSPNLLWTGDLAVGAAATITFSMTVDDPDEGDRVLINVVSSTATGNNCPAASSDPRCRETVSVQVPGLTITKSADATTTTPGSTVEYTLTITNTGQTAYTGLTVTDDLTNVVDDADYENDAMASAGSVSFTSPNLVWTGNLAVGAPEVRITYTVTVAHDDIGDHELTNVVTSSAAANNCPTGSSDPRCSVTVPVADLDIEFTTDPATSTTPGSVVTFNTTITNTGEIPYNGITLALPRAGISDDATANGDQTATSGTLTLTATDLEWTGDVPVGGDVLITGHVTVHDPDTGNKLIEGRITTSAEGSNCPPGNTDPRCA